MKIYNFLNYVTRHKNGIALPWLGDATVQLVICCEWINHMGIF